MENLRRARPLLKLLILLALYIAFCHVVTVQSADTDNSQLTTLKKLVFGVQTIFIKYDCAYQDKEGVCSPKSSPDCSEVQATAVCVLNSCEAQSEADRTIVAGLLAQIAQTTYPCDVTAEGILAAANGQPSVAAHGVGFLLLTVLSVLSAYVACLGF